MLKAIINQNIFVYIMIGVCIIALGSRSILNSSYKKMTKSAESMGSTNRELLKNIRTKFENCYKLKIKINNVEAFVNKSLLNYKILGLSVRTWEKFNRQAMVLCFSIGIVGSLYGMYHNFLQREIVQTFLLGIISGLLLLFIEFSNRMEGKRHVLAVHIEDYLENFLKNKLEQDGLEEKKEVRKVREEEKKKEEKKSIGLQPMPTQSTKQELSKQDLEYLKSCISEMAVSQHRQESSNKISAKEEQFLEDILKDFFAQS